MITESDLRWAYHFYVGRPPDGPEAVAYFLQHYGTSDTRLRQAFLDTPELRRRTAQPFSAASFCIWQPGKPRIAVAGHCHATNLARAVAGLADISVYGFDPVNFPPAPDDILPYLDDADYILMPHLGPEFAPLDMAGMRARYGHKTLFFSLPYFEGVHPDITYLGHRGSRIDSPVGDYHSRIAIQSYLAGDSLTQCLNRQSDGGVLALEPRTRWAQSQAEFLRREAGMDITLADWFFKTVKKQPLLYTVNHVTAEVLTELARRALKRFGIDHHARPPVLAQNTLASSVIWPVYPDVAKQLGLRYATGSTLFVDHYAMPMADFLLRSYDRYERADRGELEAAARERGLI